MRAIITHHNPEPAQPHEDTSSEDDDSDYRQAPSEVHAEAERETESNSDDREVFFNFKHQTPLRVAPTSDETQVKTTSC